MVIEKRRAKQGFIGANLGSKMGSCWAENRRRLVVVVALTLVVVVVVVIVV